MLKSNFIGVCLLKPTFAFLGGQLPNLADFLQSLIWPSGARILRPPRIGDFPGPVGKRTNIISSVIFIIKVLSKDKLIPLARNQVKHCYPHFIDGCAQISLFRRQILSPRQMYLALQSIEDEKAYQAAQYRPSLSTFTQPGQAAPCNLLSTSLAWLPLNVPGEPPYKSNLGERISF